MFDQSQIDLYRSLFRGRDDVYARHWEKNGRSGWSPAYTFDWTEFNAHRAAGGSLKDFENKELTPLIDHTVTQHLQGKEAVGVYPILSDNTSHFIAADFDKASWQDDVRSFVAVCAEHKLRPYCEISRSGNGGHVWVFYTNAYPCWKSRQIMLKLLEQAFPFQQTSSFDRLFPNQDEITEGGFGNLIALPLQGTRTRKNCSIFYRPENGEIYQDQWKFLREAHRHTTDELDQVYTQLFTDKATLTQPTPSDKLIISLNNGISLNRNELPPTVTGFIKEELNIFNKEYGIKKHLGQSVYGTERYFHLVEECSEEIKLPRGFLVKLTEFLDEQHIAYEIQTDVVEYHKVNFKSLITLRKDQTQLVEQTLQQLNGIIIAPPGSGKTVVGLELATRLQLPTLILVHRNLLLTQWVERIEQFLDIPKRQTGTISGTRKKIGDITVATIQSLARYDKLENIKDKFGLIIVDECHHLPAKTYRDLITKLSSRYCYGLTATHERKYGHEVLTELCIGPVLAELQQSDHENTQTLTIDVVASKITLPFRYKTDHYETLAKTICYDSARNNLVVKQILKQIKKKKRVLVLTERKDHIEVLSLYLRSYAELLTLSGDDSAASRKLKLKQVEAGNFEVLLATGQLFGEGIDITGFDVLVLAFPVAFEGKLKQYIGRLRGEGVKQIIDIHDKDVEFLDRQFKKRQKVYDKLMVN